MQPALGVSSGCVRLRNASDSRAAARSAAGSPGDDAEHRRQQDLAGLLQAAAIVAERHRRRRHVDASTPSRVASRTSVDEIADQPAAEVRVAEDRAADGARRAGPRLETGAAVVDRPAHEAVDRDRGVRADVRRRRSRERSPPRGRITRPRTPASDTSTFDPPPSIVTGTARRARERQRASRSRRSLRVSSSQSAGPPTRNVVSGASGASRRDAIGAERRAQRVAERRSSIGRRLDGHQRPLLRDQRRQRLPRRADDERDRVAGRRAARRGRCRR